MGEGYEGYGDDDAYRVMDGPRHWMRLESPSACFLQLLRRRLRGDESACHT